MLHKCNVCVGCFTVNFLHNHQPVVCILQKEHNKLKKINYVLQDFVTSNIRVLPPTFLLRDQSKSSAAVAATNRAAVGCPEHVVMQDEAPTTPLTNGVWQITNK